MSTPEIVSILCKSETIKHSISWVFSFQPPANRIRLITTILRGIPFIPPHQSLALRLRQPITILTSSDKGKGLSMEGINQKH